MTGRVLESNDNGDGPTEEVFTRILNEYIRLEKEGSGVRAKQKALKKKAEDDGIDMGDLKDALKMVSADPREVIAKRNRELQYARWLKAPVGEQLQMLDMPPDQSKMSDQQRTQKWSDEGFQAGILGRDRDTCPHSPGTPGADAWLQGYEEGQKRNLAGIKGTNGKSVTDASNAPKLNVPDGGPKRRGRPPKNQTAASSSEADKGATPPAPPPSGDSSAQKPPAPPKSTPLPDDDEPASGPPSTLSDEDAEWEAAAPSAS